MTHRLGPAFLAAIAAALLAGSPAAAGKLESRATLTGSEGQGDALLVVKDRQRGAKLRIKVSGLAPRTEYKVLSEGQHLGDVTTNRRGKGKVQFQTSDRGGRRKQALQQNPAGAPLVIASVAGDPVLQGDLPPLTPAEEPSPSVSPSVSPFDGGLDDPCDPSPSPSPSASPPCGGDGDGKNDDEPSPSVSTSASPDVDGDEADPSPTASASPSADDVSPSVSDDEENSPSEEASLEPSPDDPSPDDPTPSDSDEPSTSPSVSPSTSPSPSGEEAV